MNSTDFSVVIQGPIHQTLTPLVIASVRQFLPGAEIILSTWQNEVVRDLDLDVLVLNQDPGTALINSPPNPPLYNNLNRQLVSTRNGLLKASRRYALKLRSDFILTKTLDFALLLPQPRNSQFSIFQQNVVCLNIYTRNPLKRPVLFHITDLFMFGLTADLLTYWEAPLVDLLKFSRWMLGKKSPWVHGFPKANYLFRCSSEQYLGECLAKKLFQFRELQYLADGNCRLLFMFIRLLANNFIILSPAEAGVLLPERMSLHLSDFDLYHPASIQELQRFRQDQIPWLLRLKFVMLYSLKRLEYSRPLFPLMEIKHFIMIRLGKIKRFLQKISSYS